MRVKRQKPIFMLVGNKCDKTFEREVSRDEGVQMARTFGCEFLETSAKTPTNVERLFHNLVRALRNTRPDAVASPVVPPPSAGLITQNEKVEESRAKPRKKRFCVIV